jgi:hypothetical protein
MSRIARRLHDGGREALAGVDEGRRRTVGARRDEQ